MFVYDKKKTVNNQQLMMKLNYKVAEFQPLSAFGVTLPAFWVEKEMKNKYRHAGTCLDMFKYE